MGELILAANGILMLLQDVGVLRTRWFRARGRGPGRGGRRPPRPAGVPGGGGYHQPLGGHRLGWLRGRLRPVRAPHHRARIRPARRAAHCGRLPHLVDRAPGHLGLEFPAGRHLHRCHSNPGDAGKHGGERRLLLRRHGAAGAAVRKSRALGGLSGVHGRPGRDAGRGVSRTGAQPARVDARVRPRLPAAARTLVGRARRRPPGTFRFRPAELRERGPVPGAAGGCRGSGTAGRWPCPTARCRWRASRRRPARARRRR